MFVGEPRLRPPRAFDDDPSLATGDDSEALSPTRVSKRIKVAARRRSRPADELLTWVRCDDCHKWRSLPVEHQLPPARQW